MDNTLSPEASLQIAERVRDQLVALRQTRLANVVRQADSLLEGVERLRSARRRLAICLDRQWPAAAEEVLDELESSVRELPYYAGQVPQACGACRIKVPTLREIVAELDQLAEEFDEVRYAPKERALSVVTEAIELEDTYLGEFEIRLDLNKLAEPQRSSAYAVIALDPHPATCNDAVTHPHVSDERLCTGDGGAAIGAALAGGRICDFFQLVNAILTTYNPSSPYVSLADWDGRACYDCGCTVGADDTLWCTSCERDFCENCTSYCRRCDDTTCAGCLKECPVCRESVCPSCMTHCESCGETICRSCAENDACPCHEDTEETDDDERRKEQLPLPGIRAASGTPGG